MTESNLTAKFATFEDLIAANHTEVMDALNTIAFALGAPPSAPTITLATVVDAITAGNLLLATGNDNTAAILDVLHTDLESINLLLDTINSNNSTNAQLIYGAILQTACACDTEAPLLEPPLIVSPTPLAEDEKCARIQFYLSIFGALIDNIANFGGAGATITGATVAELLFAAVTAGGLTGGEVGALAGPPGIIVGAIVGIIAAIVGALGSAYLFQLSSQWHQSPLPDELLAALYAANSADEGNDAFFNVIDASTVLNTPFKPLIIALFWNGWSNDIYSDTPVVDASAFDSTICAPDIDLCYTFTTSEMDTVSTETGDSVIPHWAKYGLTAENNPGHTNPVWVPGNWDSWTFNITSGSAYHQILSDGASGSTGASGTIGIYGDGAYLTFVSNAPFALELCPPA